MIVVNFKLQKKITFTGISQSKTNDLPAEEEHMCKRNLTEHFLKIVTVLHLVSR